MNWKLATTTIPTSFAELEELLVENRGIADTANFFNPPQPHELSLQECALSKEVVTTAVERIQRAKIAKEKVVIFGDYDADGICATAITWLALQSYGITARPFIPLRDKHGYGLSIPALREVLESERPDLIITVDNGIVAHEALTFLAREAIDVIVTDHHQPELELPPATAIVHTQKLCGATVVWMLLRQFISEAVMTDLLDLAAIATVADQVPLTDANRSFAFHGINRLQNTQRKGIISLLHRAGIEQETITSSTIGFVLAPRINAMGRLAHGMDALRLLCTQSEAQVARLTELLSTTNEERQQLTTDLYNTAFDMAKKQEAEHAIVVASPEFHEGVIGLIAGRLVESFQKPAIVLSIGKQTAKASVRSIPGVDIISLLRLLKSEMVTLGGHPMAAGFGIEVDKLAEITVQLHQLAREYISREQLELSLTADAILPPNLMTLKLLELQEKFAPFSNIGNTVPTYVLQNMWVREAKIVGKEGTHLAVTFDHPECPNSFKAIGWRKAELLKLLIDHQQVSVIGTFEKNWWQGKAYLQFTIEDVRLAEQSV